MLIVGGFLAAAAALVAGTSGFGFALLATPALVLCGFSLPFVVTVNLLISLATRVSVAWRLRRAISRRRVALLVGAAVPGLWIGSRTLGTIDEHALKIVV
ncbi:MAG: TSUP family transporter, partial [Gaiellaceae bacterium]